VWFAQSLINVHCVIEILVYRGTKQSTQDPHKKGSVHVPGPMPVNAVGPVRIRDIWYGLIQGINKQLYNIFSPNSNTLYEPHGGPFMLFTDVRVDPLAAFAHYRSN